MSTQSPSSGDALAEFHATGRKKIPKVTFEKSVTPMVWLDSSVLIDMAKIEAGENVEAVRAARLKRLREIIRKKVLEERLICPEWDQRTEFEGRRLESEIRRLISDLSCGARCRPSAGVKDRLFEIGLEAYLKASEQLHIQRDVYFYEDPLSAIREAKDLGFVVDVTIPKPGDWLARTERAKGTTKDMLEGLRHEYHGTRRTFDEQLAMERIGESDAMIGMLRDYYQNVAQGKNDFFEYMGVYGYLMYISWWKDMKGPGPGWSALYSFMRSPYYWELPMSDISCRLCADLLVRHHEVRSGDQQDVEQLATAIPVAHYIVADKAMVDRCHRLGIDDKWNTKLFSTRTLDDLSAELEAL